MVILCLFCFSHLAVAHEIDECIIDTTSESNMPVDLVVGNNCSLSSSDLIFYYPEGIDQDSEIVFQILDYDDGLLFTNNGDYSEKDIIYLEPGKNYLVGIEYRSQAKTIGYYANMTIIDSEPTYNSVWIIERDVGLHNENLELASYMSTQYEREPNNTFNMADAYYNDANMYGIISSSSDRDWYKISWSMGGAANFFLGDIPSGCDYDMRIYSRPKNGGSLNLVRSLTSSGTSFEMVTNLAVNQNYDYYIEIYSKYGYSNDKYLLRAKMTEFSLNNYRLYQYERAPGRDENGNIAADMLYCDKSISDLYNMNVVLGDLATTYSLPPSSSTVLPPQGPEALYKKMRQLADIFCASSTQMRAVCLDMIDHFLYGNGENYSNEILTENAMGHSSTQRLISETSEIIRDYIEAYEGNIIEFVETSGFLAEMSNIRRPMFNLSDDLTGGLKICINDVWGYRIEVLNYTCDGNSYNATLRYTLYDHFGLDDGDVTSDEWYLGYTQQFGSWYVLQHYDDCGGSYLPYISYMSKDIRINGTI